MIEDILPRYQETANGTKKSFTLPFDVIDSKYIMVYMNETKQTSGFSITNQELVFDSVPAAGTVITAVRVIPIDWEDYNYGALDIDKIVTLIMAKMQTLEEQVDRSLKVNIYDDSTQTLEFFLQQLADAQSVLQSAQDKLDLITSTGNSAITNINSAKEEAVQAVNEQVTVAESAAESASASATSAKASLDSIDTARDDAINTFNENATTKTSDYNDNATVKLNAYNSNADSRTTIFNTNAQTKMDSIDASVKSAAGSASAAAASAEEAAKYGMNVVQNLDSPSSDTVPSTQAVFDESNRITSIMGSDYIPYTSTKNYIKVIDVTKGTVPENTQYNDILFQDKNGNLLGAIGCSVSTDGTIETYMQACKNIAGNINTGTLSVKSNTAGDIWTYAPATYAGSSILTTLERGGSYVKLGNGLIISWGWSNAGTVTFPVAFSNIYYQVALAPHGTPHVYINNQTTTGFTLVGGASHWIAMGY